jgi:molybdate transport system ATP-binding protein
VNPGVSAHFAGRLGGFHLDAAFELPAAGATALAGPSGSGKTTILRCLAGLEHLPGRLSVAGEIWQDEHIFLPPHRRRTGFVFQGANLLPHLSVRANLDYAVRRSGREEAMDEVVERTGIGALLDRWPARLAGGEAQRVALARTLLCRPRLLLLDEPLTALDADARSELVAWLAGLLPSLDMPVLLVTHDPMEAAALATRRITIRDGRMARNRSETESDIVSP